MNFFTNIKLHEEGIKTIDERIDVLYAGHVNSKKIKNLLYFWLFSLICLDKTCNKKDILAFSKSTKSSNPLNYLYNRAQSKSDLITFLPDLSWFINFFSYLFLAGCDTKLKFTLKLRYKVSTFLLKLINTKLDKSIRKVLSSLLREYFRDNTELYLLSIKKIPKVFFSEPISTLNRNTLTLYGSAHELMNLDGLENILLLQREINLVGRQHGGGYGIYNFDYYENIELSLCNSFYGWNLFKLNEPQHRYRKMSISSENHIKGIIWIERPKLHIISQGMSPDLYIEHANSLPISFIDNIFSNMNLSISLLPHREKSNLYDNLRHNKIEPKGLDAFNYICKNTLVIFDIISATLIYFCISFDVKFIIVLDRKITAEFTPRMKEWAQELQGNFNLIFTDETEKFINLVKAYPSLDSKV